MICGLVHFVSNLLISCDFWKELKSSIGRPPARSSGCFRFFTHWSSALSSRLRSHNVPFIFAVAKSTANTSRSPNLFAHETKFPRIECCCGLARIQLIRKHAQIQDLLIVEIFDHAKWQVVRTLRLPHLQQCLLLSVFCGTCPFERLHQDVVRKHS